MKRIFYFCFFVCLPVFCFTQSLTDEFRTCRSKHKFSDSETLLSKYVSVVTDSIHVSNYSIHIDTIDFTAKAIKAWTSVTVVSKVNNVATIPLSLLQLVIDSVVLPGGQTFYSYNDTTIEVYLPVALNLGDTTTVGIYYHGNPKQDASGWGGFYFSGSYAFNLGVGFAADPHNFGRVWFPCLDVFTDRATYDFYITTDPAHKAFCNGGLVSETTNANGTKTWNWRLDQTIPTYLASMAVAPFYTLERTSNNIPVQWACLPADTVKTLNTFVHLDTVLGAFIKAYGPYPFNKVGYVEIPFNSGAMEHATSIHIGSAFVNGSLSYETLWGHELSHMWWGDKVTCETAADMWLNEGFASFNEALFTQVVNGNTSYKDWIRANHRKVLHYAHTPAQDGAYYAMNAIPAPITYGYTVYQKGADMVHTLKNYMGDTLFFNGCKYHLNTNAYGNANSFQLRDNLSVSSGINMNRFFDDWIFTPGFPHFSIDSVTEAIGALNHYYIHTRQRSRGNSHLYEMPVEINLTDGVNDTTVTFLIDSLTNTFHVALAFTPTWISIDRNEKISDAITDYERTITTTGSLSMPETFVTLNVINSGNNTTRLRIEQNWVTPDPFKGWNQGIRLSDYHYWKVDGIFDAGFLSKATIGYNGSTNPTLGYLDNTLLTNGTTEDSLVLLYREDVAHDWHRVNGYTVNKGASAIDKFGSFAIDTLKKGEYVFGIYDYTVTGINPVIPHESYNLTVSPNPAGSSCHITFNLKSYAMAYLQIIDTAGKIIFNTEITNGQQFYNWNTMKSGAGTYIIQLKAGESILDSSRLVLVR